MCWIKYSTNVLNQAGCRWRQLATLADRLEVRGWTGRR